MAETPPGVVTPQPSLPPTTTEQEDLVVERQTRVNLIWEFTQATIAVMVVACTMWAGGLVVYRDSSEDHIPTILSVAFGMITGFYFSRTNHAAIGGIGAKKFQEYIGR